MINVELLTKVGIDYEAGLKRFMNDALLYEAVLTAFAAETILERAEAAFKANDHAALLKAVHEAKGSGGNAGLNRIHIEASTLVAMLRDDSCTDEDLANCYKRFSVVYSRVQNGIRAALGL